MGKGCVFLLGTLALAGGAAAFVVLADHPLARDGRAKLSGWGIPLPPRDSGPPATTPTGKSRTDPKNSEKARGKKSEGATAPTTTKAPTTAKTAGGPAPPSGPKTGEQWGPLTTPPPTAPTPADPATAWRTALDDGRRQYKKFALAAAQAALAPATGPDVEDTLRREALALIERIETVRLLTDPIERNELSDHQDIVVVHLTSGRTREGRILTDEATGVTLEGDYGIKARFARDQIQRLERVDPVSRQADLAAQATTRRKALTNPTGLDLFRLAAWCVENGVPDRAVPLLEEALDRDAALVVTVREHQSKELYKVYIWMRSRGDRRAGEYAGRLVSNFGDTSAARELKDDEVAAAAEVRRPSQPAAADGPEPPTAPTTGGAAPAKAPTAPPRAPASAPGAKFEAAGDAAAEKARQWAEQAEPGKPGANEAAKKAVAAYGEALDAYDEALAAGVANPRAVESKMEEVSSALYWARKMQHLK